MTQAELNPQALTLHRFPRIAEESPLQAWDAADEYLLQQPLPAGPLLIFNDSFGALACCLSERPVISISDSLLSQLATQQNLRANQLNESHVTLLNSLDELPAAPAVALIKIPRTLALLEFQLRALREVATPETVIIAAAKAREIHTSTLQLFEQILGETRTSLAWKKARLVFARCSKPALAPHSPWQIWALEGSPYQLHNHAGVFSRGALDIGTRLLLRHFPEGLEGEIVDLGCGNGVIGLLALEKNPRATKVHFIDESWLAVDSSRFNIEHNRPQDLHRSYFQVNNALSGFPAGQLQAVLCNPPFHQQQAIAGHIAWQMFRESHRCLSRGGELRIVANRHLNYFHKLKKLFGNCNTIAANEKFVVLRAVKMR